MIFQDAPMLTLFNQNSELLVFISLMIAFQLKHFLCDYVFQIHADAPKKGSDDFLVWAAPS
jgi:hypothetical protein